MAMRVHANMCVCVCVCVWWERGMRWLVCMIHTNELLCHTIYNRLYWYTIQYHVNVH